MKDDQVYRCTVHQEPQGSLTCRVKEILTSMKGCSTRVQPDSAVCCVSVLQFEEGLQVLVQSYLANGSRW